MEGKVIKGKKVVEGGGRWEKKGWSRRGRVGRR